MKKNKSNTVPKIKSRLYYEEAMRLSRAVFTIALAMTVINTVFMLLSKQSFYFPFTVWTPLKMFTDARYYMSGGGESELFYMGIDNSREVADSYAKTYIAIAVVSLIIFILCRIPLKKLKAFSVAALVLFLADTVYMRLSADASLFVIISHDFLLGAMILGVFAYFKLKTLPPDTEPNQTASASDTFEEMFCESREDKAFKESLPPESPDTNKTHRG